MSMNVMLLLVIITGLVLTTPDRTFAHAQLAGKGIIVKKVLGTFTSIVALG